MKKYWWIVFPILAVIAAVVIYFFPYIEFSMLGEEEMVLNYQEVYEESGVELKIFGFDMSDKVEVVSNVDSSVLGDYEVTYTMSFGNVSETLVRKVSVKDLEAPVITASFDQAIYILQEGKYTYPKFSAVDNYDGDVTSLVTIESIDTNHIGTHFVKVCVEDSNGNVGTYIQPVVIYDDFESVKKSSLPSELKNGVYQMQVANDQLVISGYIQGVETLDALRLVDGDVVIELTTDAMSTSQSGYFETSINFDEIENGVYQLYYGDSVQLEELGAILTPCRLGRYHIGSKLVSFAYENGIMLTVEDFEYVYDIAIDVGHGGIDGGATGLSVYERDLNLKVSLYEKQRYEEHGLKVWVIREDTDYPELLGDEDWVTLQNVSYTLGWYGAVSRYTYSNHHNSDTAGVTSGPEIIVVGDVSKEDLAVEYRLYEEYKNVYKKITTDWPLFTRSYNTGYRYSREDGEIINERIWYANMRYTYECFGVVVTTYEGAYINNAWDDYWYVQQENWKKVSEAKIKAYVEALGVEYIAPSDN